MISEFQDIYLQHKENNIWAFYYTGQLWRRKENVHKITMQSRKLEMILLA